MWTQTTSLAERLGVGRALALAVFGLLASAAQADSKANAWPSAGQNLGNTRHQAHAGNLSVGSVGGLTVKWSFDTAGDVSATPAVDATRVYFPDWGGYLYAVDRQSGKLVWQSSISAASGVSLDKARATPVISGNKLIVGTQGSILVPSGGPGGKVIAFDKNTGAVLWVTQLDAHPATIVTQSASVHGGKVYVGTASQEEALAGFVPGYPCCSFKGAMFALDVETGAIVWKTAMIPPALNGYSGNAVWGSTPAIDAKRGQVYIATGNNYDVPDSVLACVAAANNDPAAQRACLDPGNLFDSIVALDLATGAIRWATAALPFDAWTVSCIPFLGDGSNCPSPAGPDYDFGQAPSLYRAYNGEEFVGAGQKSGQFWALNPDSGAVRWVTQAGPGGTAGGLQWGSAVDGRRVYTANANSNLVPWTLPGGAVVTSGVWSGLDAVTGQLLWQVTPSQGGGASGPVTTANGVVFGCSLDALGHMYALEAATGRELWRFASGGSCLSGAAIAGGMLFWGSGYSNFGFGTPNNKLYAFEPR